MSLDNSRDRWIFREGRSTARGDAVRAGFSASLARLCQTTDRLVDALIRAGEMETALVDLGGSDAHLAAEITQSIASALVRCPVTNLESLASIVGSLQFPDTVQLSIPEGFAYYALHPLAYAEMAESIGCSRGEDPRAAVIGIRSIGSTLSAVVTAALAKRGIRADRITVRPDGHPYARKTQFTPAQLHWIAEARHHRAEFFVVDEGPGLSGSSFLSVGEALLSAGVERQRIRFLCSHRPDPDALVSPRGPERWRGFETHAAEPHRPAREGLIDVSAGKWREIFPGASEIPSWVQMERVKFLSADRTRLFKFNGLGRFGEQVGQRAQALAASGFGPEFFGVNDGFAEYELLNGRPARKQDLSRAFTERIADYCAMRAAEFRVSATESSLVAMARHNYEVEFEQPAPAWLWLETSQAVLCDARMQPHEWIVADDGTLRKTDGDTHGDDHFFPGPCDIAWDLAGAIVEWEMDRSEEEALLRRFAERSGDAAGPRIESYVFAYAAFRIGFCRMGAGALSGTTESHKLTGALDRYRRWILRRLPPQGNLSWAPAGPREKSPRAA